MGQRYECQQQYRFWCVSASLFFVSWIFIFLYTFKISCFPAEWQIHTVYRMSNTCTTNRKAIKRIYRASARAHVRATIFSPLLKTSFQHKGTPKPNVFFWRIQALLSVENLLIFTRLNSSFLFTRQASNYRKHWRKFLTQQATFILVDETSEG